MKLQIRRPYKIKTNDPTMKSFVGYLINETDRTLTFRAGLDDTFLLSKKDVVGFKQLSPRDIETRKNGRYFVL